MYAAGEIMLRQGIIDSYIEINIILIGINIICCRVKFGYRIYWSIFPWSCSFYGCRAYTSAILTAKFGQPFTVAILFSAMAAALAELLLESTLRLRGIIWL